MCYFYNNAQDEEVLYIFVKYLKTNTSFNVHLLEVAVLSCVMVKSLDMLV